MAMMQKMSLNQATGIGDGKLGKRIKKKTKEIKRKVKMKLGNLGDDIRRGKTTQKKMTDKKDVKCEEQTEEVRLKEL